MFDVGDWVFYKRPKHVYVSYSSMFDMTPKIPEGHYFIVDFDPMTGRYALSNPIRIQKKAFPYWVDENYLKKSDIIFGDSELDTLIDLSLQLNDEDWFKELVSQRYEIT